MSFPPGCRKNEIQTSTLHKGKVNNNKCERVMHSVLTKRECEWVGDVVGGLLLLPLEQAWSHVCVPQICLIYQLS